MEAFEYARAFSRNIGWLTENEQHRLRDSRIAIAGLGGVGGGHLLTLARLGIGAFHISDFDRFEQQNFNRQAGAMMSHLHQEKCQTLARMARDINPELAITTFPQGINDSNLDAFLTGVDLYVDSLDFFAVDIRRKVFAACAERGIPALTAAPLGMGTAFLAFLPGKMTFEQYFRMEGLPKTEQLARFIAGLSPRMLQRPYLQVPEAVNFSKEKGPSTAMACDLCAGVMGVEVLKILLKRGPITAAPWGLHFDAYRQRYKKTWRPFGNANPLQKLLIALIRSKLNLNG
ncbi:MAG TPA: ThiF family adenylyltransferase [Permianibacter sp.]|nr:ThiF family adenylyltransferase [Permianibacter sp.]